ncbi:hypothetical protein SUGI_0246750 [Cryptomeria japonica]|uniref:uncharacterized protein LOC131035953 isoform X1 n=1 Tax=Cryptomeria japonica TaxID=3369 RepID=UPI002408EDCF|nr:uncharacterized protein LOC131035953 isoform X1 [Cryptomeria japonica]GLJ15097.1 hypothetical protein SUGI_0246750 [Cryptomeria japonica]
MGKRMGIHAVAIAIVCVLMIEFVMADDNNRVFSPCSDTLVQKKDGFTFGLAFATRESFFSNNVELSPCDKRLALSSKSSQAAVFRPKVDQISLLTINTTSGSFSPEQYGYMVAFAGHKYAARSIPRFVADSNIIITSFTLALEFNKGRLQNLYWKSDNCDSCSGNSSLVCYKNQACAIRLSTCKSKGGSVDCSLGIQVAFSGTDKHDAVLNSWYEVSNLRQYSLYGLYSNLKGSLTSQFSSFF